MRRERRLPDDEHGVTQLLKKKKVVCTRAVGTSAGPVSGVGWESKPPSATWCAKAVSIARQARSARDEREGRPGVAGGDHSIRISEIAQLPLGRFAVVRMIT
jgi:hypothetical protein